ncbi:unnamed protein product [Alopecurus aequalis]
MKPLLSKLSKLLEEEYTRLKGLRRDTEATREEMHSMKAALEALADGEQLDPEMISWKDDVRELSYDMEDCLDDYMARAEHKQNGPRGFKGFCSKLKKLKPRHEIAGEIEMLKARAIEASKRHKRYKVDHPSPDSITRDIDPRLHALYVDVGKLVGIDGPKEHIIEWFKKEASSTQLPVLSIVGPGGLGKTTLANAVYGSIKRQFSCEALGSVSRKPDIKNVLRDIAERVGITGNTSNDDVRRLIDRLREHLQAKKYLIVIDDIWSTEAWKTIRDALPNNDHGSTIITTTRNCKVASFSCLQGGYLYRMKPLSSDESRRLFLQRAFGSEDLCPPHLEEVSKRILKKCAGLPLAIITLSSFLADQTAEEEWSRVLTAIGSSLVKDDGAGDMTKILSLSYFDLPQPMRTLLLYFSAFPEDHIIDKRCLIHKWIAEGFIHEEHGQGRYEVGEGYFNELINRCLIQPTKCEFCWEDYGDVLACRVHDIILDFISRKAKEENFMTSFGDAEQAKKHKVRRLSVVAPEQKMVNLSGDLSHIRSLALFGSLGQHATLDCPFLRVLDLGKCKDLKREHLANIEKQLLLRYLCLGSDSITALPEGIGKLKYLETLDMHGIRIEELPSTMTRLQRLARLYATFTPTCLSDEIIGQLHSIEELENVMVLNTELGKFLRELEQLTKLRTLSVTVMDGFDSSENEDAVRFVGTLISSYNISNLRIDCEKYGTDVLLSLEPWSPVNRAGFRKICIHGYYIEKVPSWMMSLMNLRGLDLRMHRTGPEDLVILGAIPALSFLKLTTSYGRSGRIFIRGFRSLRYFNMKLSYCGTAVEFEAGSMPKLEHLELQFGAHDMKCVNGASDFGIQHLSALTKADIFIGGNKVTIYEISERIKSALEKLRNRPTLSLQHYLAEECAHFETAVPKLLSKEMSLEEAGSSHQHIHGGSLCSYLGRRDKTRCSDPLKGRGKGAKLQHQMSLCPV